MRRFAATALPARRPVHSLAAPRFDLLKTWARADGVGQYK
jgi:hypothetical protein